MQSLFVKILLGFVIVVILVGTSLETSSILANYFEVRWQVVLHSIMPMEAEKSARLYEQSGKQALEDYLDDLQRQKSVRFYFFDEDGNSLLDRGAPELILKLAKNKEGLTRTAQQNLSLVNPRQGIALRLVPGPSGRRYTLAFQQSPTLIMPMSEAVGTHPYLRLLVVGILGAGLCLLLTYHITRPINRLRKATEDLAAGKLKTRIDRSVRRRHDEIGSLGRDFDRMAEQIEALVSAQRELLGDVSHELRSPLARMIVAIGLLKHASADEAPEYINRINHEAERLDKMIGQLLTLTRIESGAEVAQRERFDFTNLVQEVAADGEFEARAHQREVKVTRADSCMISGIPEMLRSAIENVVRNAIRYTAEGTAVEISLARTSGDEEKVGLTIRDHGPGVPKIMLANIFQPFQRVPVNEPNSDRAIHMHNGSIRAANAHDGGLIVEITLPA